MFQHSLLRTVARFSTVPGEDGNDINLATAGKAVKLSPADAGTYAFTSGDDVGYMSEYVTSIAMAATDATITGLAIDVEITTASGSNTYTIGSTPYTASDSALVIDVKADSTSTLSQGTVALANSNDAVTASNSEIVTFSSQTTGTDGITVTVTDSDVTMVSAIDVGDSFTIQAADSTTETYTRTSAGIFRTIANTTYLSGSNVGQDSINFETVGDSDWLNIINADDGYVINLAADDAQQTATIFDSNSETYLGELTVEGTTYNQSKRRYYH